MKKILLSIIVSLLVACSVQSKANLILDPIIKLPAPSEGVSGHSWFDPWKVCAGVRGKGLTADEAQVISEEIAMGTVGKDAGLIGRVYEIWSDGKLILRPVLDMPVDIMVIYNLSVSDSALLKNDDVIVVYGKYREVSCNTSLGTVTVTAKEIRKVEFY